MIPLLMVQKQIIKIVAMSGNSSIGVAQKSVAVDLDSTQQVAVLTYSETTDSSSL